jgi:hypothetical protein
LARDRRFGETVGDVTDNTFCAVWGTELELEWIDFGAVLGGAAGGTGYGCGRHCSAAGGVAGMEDETRSFVPLRRRLIRLDWTVGNAGGPS